MDKKQFAVFVNAMRTYYPREKLLPNNAAMELWFDALQDLDYRAASDALKRWAATEKWSPSIADIRAGVVQIYEPEVALDWSDGWREVTRAISNYGSWNKEKALESMSPVTKQCVLSIGWENICGSENISVERGHFRTMFTDKMERHDKARQIPEQLRNPAEKMLLDFGERLKLN